MPFICTSRSRRIGNEYRYDVDFYEATASPNVVRFCARVVNMVRLESGHTVPVNAELPDQLGATLAEAFANIEEAVEMWAKARIR